MQSARITFYPSKITGTVPKGITVLEAAGRLGIDMEGPCGGTGKCGKDLVQVRTNKTLDTVLACKTRIESDLEVIVPFLERKTLKTVECFFSDGMRTKTVNSCVKKEVIPGDRDICSTKVYVNNALVSVEDGNTRAQSYGVALDIGTTTLVAALINLNSGEIAGSSGMLNPLVTYGHDVMSRIKYSASQKDGLLKMHRELISAVNLLVNLLSSERGIRKENIYQVAGAGNTTMQHIFANKEIKGIGEYPYKPETLDVFTTTAMELSLDVNGYAPVTTFPCISAYVGGDIVSGLIAVDPQCTELPAIFLDIGTNGEMVLLLNGRMVATSTAAGPCFEGMTISSGMRAGEGAIERVNLGEELSVEVIGNCPPQGICGSGLLDIVSELLRVGLINSRGRLQGKEGKEIPEKYKKYLCERDGKRHFQLSDGVSLSQEDIRQVQLAKAAIRSGVEILLAACDIKPEDVKTVIIAGAFGYHLKQESLFRTGFLPELRNARLLYVGNSSLEGAVRLLLDKELIRESVRIAGNAQVVELSQIPGFEDIFVREMHFSKSV
ncbi:ASKHA domain-containing protein [Candidatus Magnetobacterium casense]|uniref:DUF4445 domain-containing protein n=1 Tax=Candidatus Magnetobacterium casense TaxID=1455061 RepID=A0ABS6S288_9BACT|nr:ASKHA domain-containing protein [Candidatus Magnetobacterium casensis]MBV6342950.1 DUF4445 domain-containing protein [Candidatus Magnetobacterium casensis]